MKPILVVLLALAAGGCGDSDSSSSANTGAGGSATGGTAGSAAGNSGTAGSAGSAGLGGTSGAGGTAGTGGASGTGGSAGSGGTGGTGGSPTPRTVETRSPFGSARATNLLIDGDFELTTAQPIGGASWFAFSNSGSLSLPLETGGLCSSGLRCVRLAAGQGIVGLAPAPDQLAAKAGVSIFVGQGTTCSSLQPYVIKFLDIYGSGNIQPIAALGPVSPAPDAAGWCSYQGAAPVQKESLGFLLQNSTTHDIVVDDAFVEADTSTTPAPQSPESRAPKSQVLTTLTPQLQAQLRSLRTHIRNQLTQRPRPPQGAGEIFR